MRMYVVCKQISMTFSSLGHQNYFFYKTNTKTKKISMTFFPQMNLFGTNFKLSNVLHLRTG